MEQSDAPKENVFYARLGVVVKSGGQAYCVFCPERVNRAFINTQGGGSHAVSKTHCKHFQEPLPENLHLAQQGVVWGARTGWCCVPCGVRLSCQELPLHHTAGGLHTANLQCWHISMHDKIRSRDIVLGGEAIPQPVASLPRDVESVSDQGTAEMMEEEEEEEAYAWLHRDAEVTEAAGVSRMDWMVMGLGYEVAGLGDRVNSLETRVGKIEQAGTAGHDFGGGGGGGNPPGSSGGGDGLDPGRHGGPEGGLGGGKDQDKGAGGDQGVQYGEGSYVCMSFNYSLMLAPTLLAWLQDPKKAAAALLFVVAVALLAAKWRNPALAAQMLHSPATLTNQSLATTSNHSHKSAPSTTVEELSRLPKGAVLADCKKRDPHAGSAWDRLGRSDSSKFQLYAQCA